MQDQLYKIIAAHCGQDLEKIRQDADRDNWMSPQDAKEYGLIDRVLTSRKEIGKSIPEIPSTTAGDKVLIEQKDEKEPAPKDDKK